MYCQFLSNIQRCPNVYPKCLTIPIQIRHVWHITNASMHHICITYDMPSFAVWIFNASALSWMRNLWSRASQYQGGSTSQASHRWNVHVKCHNMSQHVTMKMWQGSGSDWWFMRQIGVKALESLEIFRVHNNHNMTHENSILCHVSSFMFFPCQVSMFVSLCSQDLSDSLADNLSPPCRTCTPWCITWLLPGMTMGWWYL